MKILRSKPLFIIILIAVSCLFFLLQSFLFNNTHEGLFLLFQDLVFLPIHVVLVTLILDKIISIREKEEKMERLNILINDFFNEAGSDILEEMNRFVKNQEEIKSIMQITANYKDDDFKNAVKAVENVAIQADIRFSDIGVLKNNLLERKRNVLAMVENPSLLEHDRFTEMLWAVYHMTEELKARDNFHTLPHADFEHLCGDLKRAYRYLCIEWLFFNQYIKKRYPYLFSLSLRKSPFTDNSVIFYE